MPPLKRLVKEPLIHFIALALLIFAGHSVIAPSDAVRPDRIVITEARIAQLAEIFSKSWQRTPTSDELKRLIDDHVKEEIYYREAKALRLDMDDTVIRRRLRLKMEFLNDSAVDTLVPTDVELGTYLRGHPTEFAIQPMLAFQQVFLNLERQGDKIDQDAAVVLKVLLANPAMDPVTLGDASLLPQELPLTSKSTIGQTFGGEFADALDRATPGQWTGPIKSSFGLHIVRVSEHKPGHMPKLSEVRDVLVREWANDRRKELEDNRFNELLKRYEVIIESSQGATVAQ